MKVLPAALALALLLSLPGTISVSGEAASALDEVKWCRASIPTEGETGDWVLASGSNVRHLTRAVDGTLYCYASPSGTSYTLFKSTDAGRSWSHTGKVTDTIVDIATAPDDASIIYYASTSDVYKSDDAGISFTRLPLNPGGAGSDNVTIASMDVTRLDGRSIVAVGTSDADAAQYGGVYILDEEKPFAGWIDTAIGSYDICELAFSPKFTSDRQLVAVASNEIDTLITTRIDDADWGGVTSSVTVSGLASISAGYCLPRRLRCHQRRFRSVCGC
ncbi:WD40/YVTN/BNR-like repeat-containing protein [Chloroflexota bacterium]